MPFGSLVRRRPDVLRPALLAFGQLPRPGLVVLGFESSSTRSPSPWI